MLSQAVEYLATGWTHKGPLDLANVLVVVPTRQSGRRLREGLATHAATFSAAVFPPRVLLPDSVITAADNSTDSAPRLVALLAWVEVFQSVALEDFRKVFPVDPPSRDFGWALRVAQQFTRLQHTLVESGLLLSDVSIRTGTMFVEAERWEQIARLEQLHAQQLEARGFRDRHVVRVEAGARATRNSAFPPDAAANLAGINRIVMLGVPDPQPLTLTVLTAWSEQIPVEVIVFAPTTESAAFDEWGRPVSAIWSERVLEIPEFEKRVHLCAHPASQASRVVEALQRYETPADIIALGVADVDLVAPIESALRHTELPTFNPEGTRRKGDALYQLLSALAAFAADKTFTNVETLARCPDVLKYLEAHIGPRFSAAGFLQALDRLHTRHLPPTLAEAHRHAPQLSELQVISQLRDLLTSGDFVENASTALTRIFEARKLNADDPSDALIVEAAAAWTNVLSEIQTAAEKFREVSARQWWEVALQLYGETIHYEDKPVGAIELQGWLELLWEDAPHLVVCGLNDGRVPEAVVGDPFLPESLRESLGLKTNAHRFARDAYLLQALAHSRATHGRFDLLLGKTSTAGDPLRPSRLLLRCADSSLPQRVEFLFKPAEVSGSDLAWRRAWKLKPRRVSAPPRVAVTALRAWLACPFRFYLGRVLRMESVDPEKTELDVFDFGTLCHAALEAMGHSAEMRECLDAGVLREFLLGALEDEANRRFGANLTLPLVVQLESARQRLSRAAEVQADTRREGWVIQNVESNFELQVGELQVVGKIDRIDRHERTGVVRVLDYKTSDQPVDPWQAHLRGIRRMETAPAFARLMMKGREYVWSDLQLPLYRRALQMGALKSVQIEERNDVIGAAPPPILCGYFNLPKAAGETGIRHWEDYTLELDEAAWQCAREIGEAIRRGEFWPPNENIRPNYDEFASLFHHGVADSVEWPHSDSAPERVPLPVGGGQSE